MQDISFQHITTDPVHSSFTGSGEIGLSVLRLDKLHPVIAGNKWFKLRYYIREAISQGKKTMVTFGGAYSNHIIATAAACRQYGLDSIGIIRGEEAPALSFTLQQAKELGMQLFFVSRGEYAAKKIPAPLQDEEYYLVNEGGFGEPGAKGAATIAEHFDKQDYTHICCAVGTGTMMAGLINAVSALQKITGISVMKNNSELEDAVRSLLHDKKKAIDILHEYHFGGYAKHKPALFDCMNEFYRQTGIPTDFVYTGKLVYAVIDLIKEGYFDKGSRILLIHSGGLQGNASLPQGTLIF